MCILLLLDGLCLFRYIFEYLLSLFGLTCPLRTVFLYWFLFGYSVDVSGVLNSPTIIMLMSISLFMLVKISFVCISCSVVSDSLQPHGLYSPWNSPEQNTGVGSHSPLKGIFPTQGSNPGLPHCRWILYQLSHKGSLWTSLSTSHLSLSFLLRYACLFPFQVSKCFQLLLIK